MENIPNSSQMKKDKEECDHEKLHF